MDEESSSARTRAEELTASNDINVKRYLDIECKYEQLLLAKERINNDLKIQKESATKEIEILKSSEIFLRKSIDSINSNYNSLLDDLLEMKVRIN